MDGNIAISISVDCNCHWCYWTNYLALINKMMANPTNQLRRRSENPQTEHTSFKYSQNQPQFQLFTGRLSRSEFAVCNWHNSWRLRLYCWSGLRTLQIPRAVKVSFPKSRAASSLQLLDSYLTRLKHLNESTSALLQDGLSYYAELE